MTNRIATPTAKRQTIARLAAVSLMALAVAACADEANSQTATSEAPIELAQADTGSAAAVEAPASQGSVDMEAVLEEGPLPEMFLGEADAPVTIVEYMSLTCPHCASFHNETFDALKTKYIDGGQVRFIVRDFPFDPRAAAGAMLARCAPEGQYFPMVDMLFEQQSSWAAAQDARGALLQISRMAGFTQESFEACLTNQELLDDVNAVRQKAAEEFQVQSTPTFIINGERYAGNMSIEQMSAIIDANL
ncbi:disulfide bond formation protein DsbD [Rhizobium albus]|jgi:protein-disulfide isomerase|nr:disulfide bond formation protein DsbD [Rhizobium albus]